MAKDIRIKCRRFQNGGLGIDFKIFCYERFIRNEGQLKQINLAKYLNQYMGDKTNSTEEDILNMKQDFITMIDKVYELLGKTHLKI